MVTGVTSLYTSRDFEQGDGMIERGTSRFPFYYGWVIVGVSLLCTGFWMGILTTFSVFFVALIEDFGWSRGGAAGVQSCALLTYTVMAPFVGGLIDRFGPKRVILPGILFLCGALALCATIRNLAQFYLFYGIGVAIGFTFISIVTVSAILSHWFEKKRGLASGLAVSGMGLGTFVLVPLIQYFITRWGWRMSYLVMAGLVFIVLVPVGALFLRHKPAEFGLTVDGPVSGKVKKKAMAVVDPAWASTDWTLAKVLRTGRFWALLLFCFTVILGVYVMLIHSVRFLVDRGFPKMTAAYIFSLVGIVSLVFRIFWGWLSDRIGRELTFTIGAVFIAFGAFSLMLLEASGRAWLAYLYATFFGMGWAVTAPMFMAVAADLFQGKRFGSIYGVLEAAIGTGSATGAWVAGFIFDITGSYRPAFILSIVASLLSCVFVWMAAPRKVRRVQRNS